MGQFIGIDGHKKTSHVVVLDGETQLVVLDKNIRTTRERFEEVLGPLAPAKVLLEASTLARPLASILREQGHEVIIGNPNYLLMYASRPANRKNDREDAKALAVACLAGHYQAVHEASAEHRALQELLGTRAVVIDSRTRCVNRIRALYAGAGLTLPKCQAATLRAAVVGVGVPARVEPAVRPLLELLAMIEDQTELLDRKVARLAGADETARLLMSVPGVGPVVALEFVATLDDVARFGGAHKVESYLGLVPKLDTSGGPGRGGHISKMGPTRLRADLVQAAWGLLRSTDPKAEPLQRWTNALAARRGTGIAITALVRRLTGVLFAIWRDNKPFERREPKGSPAPADARPLVRRYRLRKKAPAST